MLHQSFLIAIHSHRSKHLLISNAPKLPSKRFTITPKVILDAKLIVIAVGTQKGEILAKCFEAPSNVKELLFV